MSNESFYDQVFRSHITGCVKNWTYLGLCHSTQVVVNQGRRWFETQRNQILAEHLKEVRKALSVTTKLETWHIFSPSRLSQSVGRSAVGQRGIGTYWHWTFTVHQSISKIIVRLFELYGYFTYFTPLENSTFKLYGKEHRSLHHTGLVLSNRLSAKKNEPYLHYILPRTFTQWTR